MPLYQLEKTYKADKAFKQNNLIWVSVLCKT